MGKHTITHLKAPWPLGAKVGDVIELAHVPAWAMGKCSPAGDDAEVTAAFESKAITVNIVPNDEALEAESKAQAEAQALADAEAKAKSEAEARQALEAEAKAMGVEFRANISDEKLAERIAEAKAKA